MIVALATDDRYAMACGVCVTSILENNKDCSVCILTEGLSDVEIARFRRLSEKYSREIDIIVIDDKVLTGLKVSERFTKAIYFRMLLPGLINADKVLYLDCDIIVNDSLEEFWNTDLDGYAAMVVEDQSADDVRIHNRIACDGLYFNSGVMLMNLDYWRENSISEKVIDYIYTNPQRCKYPDQDALNVILNGKVLQAGFEYNFQHLLYLKESKRFLHFSKWPQIERWKLTPKIIHYTEFVKPWYKENDHPLSHRFKYYHSISPWSGVAFKYRYSCLSKLIHDSKNNLKRLLRGWGIIAENETW